MQASKCGFWRYFQEYPGKFLSGIFTLRGWGCMSPGFAFLFFFSPANFLMPGSHVVPGASSPPSPSAASAQAQLPEVQSLRNQPQFVGFGFYFQLFP